MQVLQTFLLALTLSVNLAPMLTTSDSPIFESSCVLVFLNKELNGLKIAEYLNARVT